MQLTKRGRFCTGAVTNPGRICTRKRSVQSTTSEIRNRKPGKANARVEFSEDGEEVVMRCIVAIPPGAEVQGYLAHKKTHTPLGPP